MFKSIVLCFLVLAIQLAFLAHVDHRMSRSRSEVTYQNTPTPPGPLRQRGQVSEDKSDENARDLS